MPKTTVEKCQKRAKYTEKYQIWCNSAQMPNVFAFFGKCPFYWNIIYMTVTNNWKKYKIDITMVHERKETNRIASECTNCIIKS